jgi:Mpv17 / PMP22 family
MQTVSALLLLLSLLCDALASSGGSLSSPLLHEIRRPVPWQRKHRRRHSCLHVSGGGPANSRQSLAGNSAAPSSSLNLLQRYSRLIDTKPLMTKAITAGSIAALADVATQVFVLPPTIAGGVSWRRVAAFLLAGALFVGPYLHLWYSKLDAIVSPLPRHSVRTISKMLLDQSIGVSIFFPMYFTAYELASSLMHARCKCLYFHELLAPSQSNRLFADLPLSRDCSCCERKVPIWTNVANKCRLDMWSIVLMNWRIWPLANVLNFGLVPIQLQVLFNQILSFFWCIYISTRIE